MDLCIVLAVIVMEIHSTYIYFSLRYSYSLHNFNFTIFTPVCTDYNEN
jgi:hypothetical protein